MTIAVIIASYGDPAWLELSWSRAYPSVLDQGADDVIVHHDPHGTIAKTRNDAAKKTKADWLCFLDSDDELHHRYIWAMRRALTPGFLLQPAVSFIRNGRQTSPRVMPEGNLQDDNFLVVGTLVERRLFQKVKGFDDLSHGFEDWSLWAKCWKAGAQIQPVPKATYVVHVNPHSKRRLAWRNRREQIKLHYEVRRGLFPELPEPGRRWL